MIDPETGHEYGRLSVLNAEQAQTIQTAIASAEAGVSGEIGSLPGREVAVAVAARDGALVFQRYRVADHHPLTKPVIICGEELAALGQAIAWMLES